MYGCESWTIKKAEHQRIDPFELWWRTLESLLDSRETQPVHPKGNQSFIFIGRTDAEAKTPILWSPDVKNWLVGKDPDAGKDLMLLWTCFQYLFELMFSSGYIPRSRITGSYGSSIFNDKPSEYFKVDLFTSSFYKKGILLHLLLPW